MAGKFLTGGLTEGNRALSSQSAAVWPLRGIARFAGIIEFVCCYFIS
jgi:hypothetical protein